MKQVNVYQCSFCGDQFNDSDECFAHELAIHHEMADRHMKELSKYCEIMKQPDMGGCDICQFEKRGVCLFSKSPVEWYASSLHKNDTAGE